MLPVAEILIWPVTYTGAVKARVYSKSGEFAAAMAGLKTGKFGESFYGIGGGGGWGF